MLRIPKTSLHLAGILPLVLIFGVCLPLSTTAETRNLQSTGFTFTLPEDERRIPTIEGLNEIGVFSVPIPPDTFPAPGDAGDYEAVEVSVTLTMVDGDTAPADIDEDDLALALGIYGTDEIFELPSLLLHGFPNEELATVTNTLDLTTMPGVGSALARFISRSEGLLTCFIIDLDEGGNFLDFRDLEDEPFALSITLVSPPKGRYTLTTRAFIDYRCDTFYKNGLDRPLADVPVIMSFPNGSEMIRFTRINGYAFFSGFDASEGVMVRVELPGRYRSYALRNCLNSPEMIQLRGDQFGAFRSRFVQFRAEPVIDR